MAFQVSPGVNFSEVDLTAAATQVSVSDAAFAGPFNWGPALDVQDIGSEDDLVTAFGKPDDIIASHWFSAQSFLSYSNLLHVVRSLSPAALNATVDAIPLTGTVNASANATWTAVANTGFTTAGLVVGQKIVIDDGNAAHATAYTVSVIQSNTVFQTTANGTGEAANASVSAYGVQIANSGTYNAEFSAGFPGYGAWAAKWPGELGNSIKVSSCDSSNAFASTPNGSISVTAGSNVVTGSSTFFSNDLIVGDYIVLGSGQKLQVSFITNNTSAQTSTTALVSNTFATTVWSRSWEFASQFDSAPSTSTFAANLGASRDEIHVAVVDVTGTFSGTVGAVLERFPFMSKGKDALDNNGVNNYYVNVLNQGSKYICG